MNSQQSLKDQIKELCKLGNKAGLYDAVDFVQGFIRKQEIIKKRENKCKKEKLGRTIQINPEFPEDVC